jgi:hypothetical protein
MGARRWTRGFQDSRFKVPKKPEIRPNQGKSNLIGGENEDENEDEGYCKAPPNRRMRMRMIPRWRMVSETGMATRSSFRHFTFLTTFNTSTVLQKCASEHFHKYCSHSVGAKERAVFLSFGFVLPQLQGCSNLRLRQSLAKTLKSSLRMATVFLQTLKSLKFALTNFTRQIHCSDNPARDPVNHIN